MKIALCNHRNTLKYKNEDKEWSYLVERNRTPVRTAETVLEYMKMTKEERVEAKDVGGYYNEPIKQDKNLKKISDLDIIRIRTKNGGQRIWEKEQHTRQSIKAK